MVKIQFAVLSIAAIVALRAQNNAAIPANTREFVVEVSTASMFGTSPGLLTGKDFSISEDNKPQKITSAIPSPSSTEPRHLVIDLDFSGMTLADQQASRQAAQGFIDSLPGRDNSVAIVANQRVIENFTTSKALLKQILGGPIAPKPANQGGGDTTLISIAHSVERARGRKVLLFFTNGYFRSTEPLKADAAACSRANLAVYTIIPDSFERNLAATAPANTRKALTSPRGISTNVSADASELAEETGGRLFNLGDKLPQHLSVIATGQDTYRITYTPPPAVVGSCHTLRVASTGRGPSPAARSEYCTAPTTDLIAEKINDQAFRAHTANAGSATIQLPWFYTGPNRADVYLSFDLTPTGMNLEQSKAGFSGQIDLVGIATKAEGEVAERFGEEINIDKSDQAQADVFTHSPWHYERRFSLTSGKYTFQISWGAGGDAVGKLDIPLTIEPFNPSDFAIGAIALATESRATDPSAKPQTPEIESEMPLVAGNKQFIPASTNHIRKPSPVYLYTEVYEPSLSDDNPGKVTMRLRIVDRATNAPRIDTGMIGIASYVHPGNPVIPFATALPIAQLPAGSYTLQIFAAHSSSPQIVERSVDLDIE